jgi:aldehyde dehydrogenase (NAD+)
VPLVRPPLDLLPHARLVIGEARNGFTAGGYHRHVYAGDGSPTAPVPLGGANEIDEAVRCARLALPAWRGMRADRRRDVMLGLSGRILADAERLAMLQTIENSTPQQVAALLPQAAADYFTYNAGWIDKIGGTVIPSWSAPGFDYSLEEPYGVVGIIIPWNSPLVSFGQLLGPALAAGNTVVVKPSELAPFTSLRLAELVLKAGFPPGAVNVIPGGAAAGEALVCHPGVDKIHFTGSCATGRKVLAGALHNLTPVGLELGGKSALLVFSDADLGAAAHHVAASAAVLSGQGCTNGTRVLVEATIYDRFAALVKGFMRRIRPGDPFDRATGMGPVITEEACLRILGIAERARRGGEGQLLAGGTRLGGDLSSGFFIGPTLFGDVDPASPLAQEEIFGPVISMMRFESERQAIDLANGTRYGLAAYVYSGDADRARVVAGELEAGSVWINGWGASSPSMPFGGAKQSGYGRVGGRDGIREFTRPKNIWMAERKVR